MRATRVSLLLAVGLAAAAYPRPSAAQATAYVVRESAAPCLKIRTSPDADASVVASVDPGTRLEAVGTAPYWRHVRLTDGTDGWAAKKYLDSISDTAAVPPDTSVTAATPDREDAWLEVHVVDVGQGDGIWIRTFDDGVDGNGRYEGRSIIIDGGPDRSDGCSTPGVLRTGVLSPAPSNPRRFIRYTMDDSSPSTQSHWYVGPQGLPNQEEWGASYPSHSPLLAERNRRHIMADALVRELNRLGYQPVFLPRTGTLPPELYNYVREQKRLVRRGALGEYLPQAKTVVPTDGQLANIAYKYTSEKKLEAAVSFLSQALKCIGIDAAPKIDLGFTGSKDFSFAFTDVTYKSVDPALLDQVIRTLAPNGIPRAYVEGGHLHVAYEYAYAKELMLSRGDKKSFAEDISGKVGAYLDVGVKGSVSVASQSTITFKGGPGANAAFAYKSARLVLENGQWVLYPEEVMRSALGPSGKRAAAKPPRPHLPQPAVVLAVVDEG